MLQCHHIGSPRDDANLAVRDGVEAERRSRPAHVGLAGHHLGEGCLHTAERDQLGVEPILFDELQQRRITDEPFWENPTVLPLRSSILRMVESERTYQNRSGWPIISLPIRRMGAPFAKAATAAETPTPVPISMLPETTA